MIIKHYDSGIVWVKDGAHITTLTPGRDVADQPQEVQDYCANLWTEELVAAYRAAHATPEPTAEEIAEQVIANRRAAYAAEVDPLLLEALAVRHNGDDAGAVALMDEAKAKRIEIKLRYPKP